uniref:hypothetical protein n=1 Tax=Enterocloster clostridioformis TaxID=1531 RepID=UPI002674DCC6|nr:hypothetical protein [Enterocloster clostridioformis]
MAKETTKEARATETAETKVEVVQETSQKEQKASRESVYSASELAANAKKVFGTRQECVAAALKAAGKTECTVTEAKEIVGKFLKREVK